MGYPKGLLGMVNRFRGTLKKRKTKKLRPFDYQVFRYIDIQRSDNKKTKSFLTLPFKISLLLFRCSRFSSSIVPASPFLARPAFGNMKIIRELASIYP